MVEDTQSSKSESITGEIPNTLELLNMSLLSIAEEYQYKAETAHDLLHIRKAVENILQLHWVAAKNQIEIRKAELQLAALRETEANHRAQYYYRLCEVASEKVSDAELQAGLIRFQGQAHGAQVEEKTIERAKNPGTLNESDMAAKLD